MAKDKKKPKRRKARPLLLAAAGAALLLVQGCEDVGSGNLLAPPLDLSVPPDLNTDKGD